jgi:hypothetical protein
VKTQYVDMPQGSVEYVVVIPTQVPDGVDPSTLPAEMSVVPEGDEVGDWEVATWLPDPGGWGVIVDTTGWTGEYDVRTRITYGAEVPVLGPVRLRVTL